MIKEYKTIQEISGPLMVVNKVEDVSFDELAEIELPNGEQLSLIHICYDIDKMN